MRREALEVVLHGFVQQLVVGQQIRKVPQFRTVWQPTHNQQMGDLDKGGFLRQFLDGNPAVAQNPLLPINKGNLAAAGARVAITFVQRDAASLVAQGGNVNGPLSLTARYNRERIALSVQCQHRSLVHKQLLLKIRRSKVVQHLQMRQPQFMAN